MKIVSPLLFALAVLVTGCGKSGESRVPVTGKVLVNGKPAPGAAVVFHPVDPNAAATAHPVGQVDDQGNFQVTTAKAGDGAPPGDYRVTLTWYVRSPGKKVTEGDDAPARNLIPDRYTRVETTPITATVRADGADPVRIEIKAPPTRH